MTTRRMILAGGAAAAALCALPLARGRAATAKTFAFTLTDPEWRSRLNPDQYAVLREAATERPFTSPLLNEHRKGLFSCAGCQADVFASQTKFNSATGWPSFHAPLAARAVGLTTDTSNYEVRQAVHCSNCGGHLGHLFIDEPGPLGVRYCINGVALTFRPAARA